MNLLEAIKGRHTKDRVVAECNMGSAWKGCGRLDAWVLKTTWAPWTTVGYEIKQSRGDFLRDDKWHAYRDVCHEMYFVCPWKMIAPEELPEAVGLLWVNKGGKCVTKRKAHRIDPDPEKLNQLMSYVIMSRAVIKRSTIRANLHTLPRPERMAAWREWLDERGEYTDVGMAVKKRLAEMTGDLKSRNHELECENERWRKLADGMREIGLDPDHCSKWNIESRVDELRGAVPQGLTRDMRWAAERITKVATELDEWMEKR